MKTPAGASPSIDVVTVCRNAAAALDATIASVAAQTRAANRYIVIDGASTDATLDVAKKWQRHIDYFVSEPDRGIAHAMNKALPQCSGDYVLFLHAGDRLLAPDALQQAGARLDLAGRPDILAGPVGVPAGDSQRILQARGFTRWMRLKTGVLHQGAWCARGLFERIGGFDEGLRIAMDYEFFLRAYLRGARLVRCDLVLTAMQPGGISWQLDWPLLRQRLAEERRVHLQHAPGTAARRAYALYWSTYPLYKRLTTVMRRQ